MKIFLFLIILYSQLFADQFILESSDLKTEYKVKIDQKGIKFKNVNDKPVFLAFFGSKCPPCLKEIKHFNNIFEKYKDKVEIVGIESQGMNIHDLYRFKDKYKIKYKVVPGYENMSFVNLVQQLSGWKGQLPFLIIINQKGKPIDLKYGIVKEDEMEKYLKNHLLVIN